MRETGSLKLVEARVRELEVALMHLMIVVANQKEELPLFVESLSKAKDMSDQDEDILSMMTNNNKAEA